jgi:unsaturated chondroitin disaccharide hydrolase
MAFPSPAWAADALERAARKIGRVSERVGATFPHAAVKGRYDAADPAWWTAGFWPGVLWLAWRETGDARLRHLAEDCEAQLDAVLLDYDELWHDVGFMWSLSAVADFKLTGQERSRKRALLAASVLASRFNQQGRFIRAWNGEQQRGWAIVDCLMNLPLLYWASERTRDRRFRDVAQAHADTALQHFLRADGSSRHIVVFDPDTGAFVEALGGQGYGPGSTWSRGNSWAIYGFALSHRYTGEARYLEAARRVADNFLRRLPASGIPPWDFDAPALPDRPLDSSAGACAACGLLEIATHLTGDAATHYRREGERLLLALDRDCGAWDSSEEGLLRHATGHVPEGRNIDVSLIYGDYFFVEGLARLTGRQELFW